MDRLSIPNRPGRVSRARGSGADLPEWFLECTLSELSRKVNKLRYLNFCEFSIFLLLVFFVATVSISIVALNSPYPLTLPQNIFISDASEKSIKILKLF